MKKTFLLFYIGFLAIGHTEDLPTLRGWIATLKNPLHEKQFLLFKNPQRLYSDQNSTPILFQNITQTQTQTQIWAQIPISSEEKEVTTLSKPHLINTALHIEAPTPQENEQTLPKQVVEALKSIYPNTAHARVQTEEVLLTIVEPKTPQRSQIYPEELVEIKAIQKENKKLAIIEQPPTL